MTDKPIEKSYVFLNSNIICSEYPGAKDPAEARKRLAIFTEFGITDFIDLTEAGELEPYAHLLPENVKHHRFPITDVRVPDNTEFMIPVMETIDAALASGGKVCIHCWGGIGRTGVTAACYACWRGCNSSDALMLVEESFKDNPKSLYRNAPETSEQREYVRRFAEILGEGGFTGHQVPLKEFMDGFDMFGALKELKPKYGLKFPRAKPSAFARILDDFRSCVNRLDRSVFGDENAAGDLDCYLEVLTHLKMKPGCKLHYEMAGNEYYAFPKILGKENLIIEKSPAGAWEAFLLDAIGPQFNLIWHAGSNQFRIVTSWQKFYRENAADEISGREVCNSCDMKELFSWDITPRVEMGDNEATVHYCYFSAWHGFSLLSSKVHFDTGIVDEHVKKARLPYFCGIIY